MKRAGRKSNSPFSFRFLNAADCRAEELAHVYEGADTCSYQLLRLQRILHNPEARQLFFVIASHHHKTVAFLQLNRQQSNPHCFRIRGLHTHRNHRNHALATSLLQLGCKCVTEFKEADQVISFILPDNIASLRAHQRAGFTPYQLNTMAPERHLCFAWFSTKRMATVLT